MQTANQYVNELKQGAKVQGINMSPNFQTIVYTGTTAGTTQVSVLPFSQTTALTSGSIIGFSAVSTVASGGTFTVWTTTSGTVATVATGTLGAFIGGTTSAGALTGSIAVGDNVYINATAGTATCLIYVQTQA